MARFLSRLRSFFHFGKAGRTFELNGILIENETGRFTAYFLEFPDVFAEGDTEQEVKNNLLRTLWVVLEHQRKQSCSNDVEAGVSKRHFHQTLELA